MKEISRQYEILLITDSTVTSKQLVNAPTSKIDEKIPGIGELEWARWTGVLYKMFPEIFCSSVNDNNLLWHAATAKNFLYVSIGREAQPAQNDTSIDPYFFMMNQSRN